ncbi:LysR family transcriptional regulator [soil metagenome]
MRTLNLDQVRTLIAIVDLGSFAKAAQALHLAQPTVSLHIRELEQRLGVALLLRRARGVEPTPAGILLVDRGRRLLRDADDTTAALKAQVQGKSGRVRLGASTSVLAYVLPPVLARLAQDEPDIDIELQLLGSPDMLLRLRDGALDIGLVSLPIAGTHGLEVAQWRRDTMAAYIPRGWTAPDAVTPAWLAARPLILNDALTNMQRITAAWFAAGGQAPRARIELNYTEAVKSLVAAGYGASVLPEESPHDEMLRERLQVRALSPPLARMLGVAARKAEARSPATDRVLGVLADFRRL